LEYVAVIQSGPRMFDAVPRIGPKVNVESSRRINNKSRAAVEIGNGRDSDVGVRLEIDCAPFAFFRR
jgi:ribosomal protein S7